MDDSIRDPLSLHAGLQTPPSALADDADLYGAGMTSFATVQLMLALEEAFDVEFPEDRLNAKTFTSIATIRSALMDAGVKLAA